MRVAKFEKAMIQWFANKLATKVTPANVIAILFFVFICVIHSFGQAPDDEQAFTELKKIRIQILRDSIVGKMYFYDFTKVESCNKTTLVYLGTIKTNNNKMYKIMTCFYVHGQSCRGTSRILIYDTHNRYIGNYCVDMPYELPDAIFNNALVYSETDKRCTFKKYAKISFQYGLPETIRIPCDAADNGNIYFFSGSE